jgi:hypothetical protein
MTDVIKAQNLCPKRRHLQSTNVLDLTNYTVTL